MYRDVLTDSLGFDVSTNLPCIFKTKYIYTVCRGRFRGQGPLMEIHIWLMHRLFFTCSIPNFVLFEIHLFQNPGFASGV